jgi:hypothetical protein
MPYDIFCEETGILTLLDFPPHTKIYQCCSDQKMDRVVCFTLRNEASRLVLLWSRLGWTSSDAEAFCPDK